MAFQGNELPGFQGQGQPYRFEFPPCRFQHEAPRQHFQAPIAVQGHEAHLQTHLDQLHPNDHQAVQTPALAHQRASLGRC